MKEFKQALKICSVIFALFIAGCEVEQGTFSIVSIICLIWVSIFFLANFVRRKETASTKSTASNLSKNFNYIIAQTDLKSNFFV